MSLPVCVTATWRRPRRVDRDFAIYPNLPSYKAMLDKEGADRPSDIALLGDEEAVVAAIEPLAAAGATDFVASIVGDPGGHVIAPSPLSASSSGSRPDVIATVSCT